MATISEIQTLLQKENANLQTCKELNKDVMSEVTKDVDGVIEKKLKAQEERLLREIQNMQTKAENDTSSFKDQMADIRERLNLFEKSGGELRMSQPVGTAAKRARSAPVRKTGEITVVMCGFPDLSRKMEIEAFMKESLDKLPQWKGIQAFAPNVRGRIAFAKLSSDQAAKAFMNDWKAQKFVFKGSAIRARDDKLPEKRQSDGKIYAVHEYLVKHHIGEEFDKDFQRLRLAWGLPDCEVGDGC